MAKKSYILALFGDFEVAAATIAALRESSIPGFNMKDVTLKSPIDHPECAAELGPRPVYIQIFSLMGAVLGSTLGFLGISSAQANFLRQPRGGFPIIPIPPNMVITYELFILTSVFFTITACLIVWRKHRVAQQPVRRADLGRQDRNSGPGRAAGHHAHPGISSPGITPLEISESL